MPPSQLRFGDSFPALIDHEGAGQDFAACTLKMDAPGGVTLEVPYLSHLKSTQFDIVVDWFRKRRTPDNLTLRTDSGAVSFFETGWSRITERTGQSISVGIVRASTVVLRKREAPLSDPLKVKRFRSYIHGLREWSSISSVREERETDDNQLITRVLLTLESTASYSWEQGPANMTLTTDWSTESELTFGDPLRVFDWAVLESEFDEPRAVREHLAEHDKVRQLLTIAAGRPMNFRRHKVSDETFPERHGETVHYPFTELVSDRTIGEYSEPSVPPSDLQDWLFTFTQIGESGLAGWAKDFKKWERFILPTATAFRHSSSRLHDIILATVQALEAAGNILGPTQTDNAYGYGIKNNVSTEVCVLRVLETLQLGWGRRVSSNVHLARAIGDVYNDIKHFRKDLPQFDKMRVVSEATKHITQLFTLYLLQPSGELLKEYQEDRAMWDVEKYLEVYDLAITEERWRLG